MTPLNQRRLKNFKNNRRGVWSLRIFLGLFFLSACAEFIANDKPLLLAYKGGLYVPVLIAYPETTFGGIFETQTAYRDPEIRAHINAHGWMIWPVVPFSYDTVDYELSEPAPSPPGTVHFLGTDDQARDVLARVIYGFRLSVIFGVLLTVFSLCNRDCCWRVAGVFCRLDRSSFSAIYRDLDQYAAVISAHYFGVCGGAWILGVVGNFVTV